MWLPMNPAPPVMTAIGLSDMCPAVLGDLEGLEFLDVEIVDVFEGVGQQTVTEGPTQASYRILDRVARREPQLAADLIGIDPIAARIVGARDVDRDRRARPEILADRPLSQSGHLLNLKSVCAAA